MCFVLYLGSGAGNEDRLRRAKRAGRLPFAVAPRGKGSPPAG
jgi:hypothetical protein